MSRLDQIGGDAGWMADQPFHPDPHQEKASGFFLRGENETTSQRLADQNEASLYVWETLHAPLLVPICES